jgi:hypothetical protein
MIPKIIFSESPMLFPDRPGWYVQALCRYKDVDFIGLAECEQSNPLPYEEMKNLAKERLFITLNSAAELLAMLAIDDE